MVEAAGVEPASENIPPGRLHTYPGFCIRLSGAPPGWIPGRLVCLEFRRCLNRRPAAAILLVDALSGSAGNTRKDAGLKRPGLIHNRLRLRLIPTAFTSRQALGMQPELLYPRRSRFAPISV